MNNKEFFMDAELNLVKREVLSNTKTFLNQYIGQKNKGIENGVYLSLYVSQEDDGNSFSRGVRLQRMLKEAELTLKSTLPVREANIIWDQFKKLHPVEIVRSTKMSVAFFATEDFAGYLFVPFTVVENVVVARSLHLKPIINWVNSNDQFYLVTLSSKKCRLIKGDSFTMEEVSIITMPTDIVEEKHKNKNVNKTKKNLFLKRAEEQFFPFLKDNKYPIILSGVQELQEIYLKYNRDPDILSNRINGNVDKESFEELHAECLEILKERLFFKVQSVLAKYSELKPYGKVLEDLNQITIAAIQGKIKDLIISDDKFIWGRLDKKSGEIESFINKNIAIPEDDVLDDLAEIVMARGGNVVLCKHSELPTESEAFAYLK